MEFAGFLILAVLAVASAAVVVFHKSPVICALALAFNLAIIAGFYMLLNAQFLALLQIIVYAGAIMVLVLFVIMLLNLQDEEHSHGAGFVQKWGGLLLAAAFAGLAAKAIYSSVGGGEYPATSEGFGTIAALGTDLFTTFFYAFEAISLLLVVAMIGAVLLAKKRL
ncbi:MAG: NADH-quinone oxidoreductase subunit J [bacterium]|nr:NADH-quinone oxidoreductase subunit J [bacterium]